MPWRKRRGRRRRAKSPRRAFLLSRTLEGWKILLDHALADSMIGW
jgi:hypothetical protein